MTIKDNSQLIVSQSKKILAEEYNFFNETFYILGTVCPVHHQLVANGFQHSSA